MNNQTELDYLFETSWEICNKVGGIYTVLSTKALTAEKWLKDHYICIGPDLSNDNQSDHDFIENDSLYKNWRETALQEGLKIRIGRWNIKGSPIVILIDFTPFFEQKNQIFTNFWLDYHLDSIAGQWDYVEPALFGYAAGKVIESFYNFYCTAADKIIAHFHEWMTGTGILYLKKQTPQIGTVFTTHATALGRCIAGNGMPLYGPLKEYNPKETAERFNINAKFSLENLSAQLSDVLTTVSAITGEECSAFLDRDPDVLTINGFENNFVPNELIYPEKRKIARQKLKTVASALLLESIAEDALLVVNSGRYEYHNKGIDVVIKGLGKLQALHPSKEVIAFIMVPAGTTGQKEPLIQRIADIEAQGNQYVFPADQVADQYPVTHPLHKHHGDPIIIGSQEVGLDNKGNVKLIFVPVYLNGHDGVFNMNYYDLLPGFDISLFPSYYEPWGYTPLESAAFGIPTVTTSLAGFGRWVDENFQKNKSVWVIQRNDDNEEEVCDQIATSLQYFLSCNPLEKEKHNQEATAISKQALWVNFYDYYVEAYQIAIEKTYKRFEQFKNKKANFSVLEVKRDSVPQQWNRISIKSKLSDSLMPLIKLASNLWWSWNYEARQLFEEFFGTELWKQGNENPVQLLQTVPSERIDLYKNNTDFICRLNRIFAQFNDYINTPPSINHKKVAYFSMEYGISNELKIFSGGLGMLAGDYLKEASDSNVPMVGVGLLYRYGYFTQEINPHGEQMNLYQRQSFSALPVHPMRDENGNWLKISIPFQGRTFYARIWRVDVGRIPLYLLDSDCSENRDEDKGVTGCLYGGDVENRLKQEILLGIGGVRMLNLLGENPEIFHLNEGHAAFLSIERLYNFIQEKRLSINIAIELVKSSSLYTTHTPVAAGHDTFSEDLIRKYFSNYPDRFNITWKTFMGLGRSNIENVDEKFSMSILCCTLSQEINGVSALHGQVTREMFAYLYEGLFPEELSIGHVTNGVHYSTWAHRKWQDFHKKTLGNQLSENIADEKNWQKIYDADAQEIWNIKNQLREELLDEIKILLQQQMTHRNEHPATIFNTLRSIRKDVLVIGFARRFATYKRAHLLFSDEQRLNRLLNNPQRPIIFIFAGKAHPHDKAGQDLIKKIIDFSRKPEFMGKIIFLENYDMILAKKLVSGCDVWLNTPTRNLEASGTSGEKAAMNGVLNCSILDGWWAEGYKKDAGWAINKDLTYKNTGFQDEMDATTLYLLIDETIAPIFYKRNKKNIPEGWVAMMKNNFAQIAPHFTMKRQLMDYSEQFYSRLETQVDKLHTEDLAQVTSLVKWKKKILNDWENIEVFEIQSPDTFSPNFLMGEDLRFRVSLKLGNILPEEIKLEVVFVNKNDNGVAFAYKIPFTFEKMEHNIAIYSTQMDSHKVGTWNWAIRMVPSHPLLANILSSKLVKWL
ncbi:MAG: alpha-glucan family phosphorylase [Bacteroidales bacterium]|jgi:phosphorylase/glycogen(starch) synthase|nr:alpha-glucan family phosphorylase [Bacteroidales bacterium]